MVPFRDTEQVQTQRTTGTTAADPEKRAHIGEPESVPVRTSSGKHVSFIIIIIIIVMVQLLILEPSDPAGSGSDGSGGSGSGGSDGSGPQQLSEFMEEKMPGTSENVKS